MAARPFEPDPPRWRNRAWVINPGMKIAFLFQDVGEWLVLRGQMLEYWLWPRPGPSWQVRRHLEEKAAKKRWGR